MDDSPHALMVGIGSALHEKRVTAARPCGGEVTLQVMPGDYEDDGRLIAYVVYDPSGMFDVAFKEYQGDPLDMPGEFKISILWSDGTIAPRLPLYVTVTPELTVTTAGTASPASSAACKPSF